VGSRRESVSAGAVVRRAAAYAHWTLNVPRPDGEPRQWLRPYIRPAAIAGWDDGEHFPALRRAALALSGNNENPLPT
jgi:hypothetical protein